MKARNYIITTVFLALISSMMWLSCEKESNSTILKEANPAMNVDVPDDVASLFTGEQLRTYYEEIEKERAVQPLCYEFVPVMIKMDNDVLYLQESDYNTGIQFTGIGEWSNQSAIRYFEKVTFYLYKKDPAVVISGSRGEGTIFLQKTIHPEDKVFPREELLSFTSWDRMETASIPGPEDGQPLHRLTFESKLNFNGGYGKFEGAFGSATKIEVYDMRQPNKCSAAILGYVFVKPEEPKDPDS